MEKGQGEVPVYSVDELLEQAQKVGVEGVIDCGCELPNLMTAIDMAREHPGTVHAAIAIHPNEAVLHGHRGAPGPDGLPIKYKPWHDIPFDEAMAEVHRLATTYPNQVVAIGETGMDLFVPANPPRNCNARRSAPTSRSPRNSTCPCKSMTATRTRKSSKRCSPTEPPNELCSTATPATPNGRNRPRKRLVSQPFRHIQLQRQRRNPRIGETRRHEPRHGRNRCPLPKSDALPRPHQRAYIILTPCRRSPTLLTDRWLKSPKPRVKRRAKCTASKKNGDFAVIPWRFRDGRMGLNVTVA